MNIQRSLFKTMKLGGKNEKREEANQIKKMKELYVQI